MESLAADFGVDMTVGVCWTGVTGGICWCILLAVVGDCDVGWRSAVDGESCAVDKS